MGWLILLGWLLCGVWAAKVYRDKGRSPVLAFFAGVLLGPLGVLLVYISSPSKEGQDRRALAEGMKRCPACAELVKAEAQVCRYCSHSFVTPA